jgi:hypothetical protein
MSTTTNPVTSAENSQLTRTTVLLENAKVNHGETIGTISSGCAASVTVNMQTLMSTGVGFLSNGSGCTASRSLTGGTAPQ